MCIQSALDATQPENVAPAGWGAKAANARA